MPPFPRPCFPVVLLSGEIFPGSNFSDIVLRTVDTTDNLVLLIRDASYKGRVLGELVVSGLVNRCFPLAVALLLVTQSVPSCEGSTNFPYMDRPTWYYRVDLGAMFVTNKSLFPSSPGLPNMNCTTGCSLRSYLGPQKLTSWSPRMQNP